MPKQVVLKGTGVSKRLARQIITVARKAKSQKECPYRYGIVRWSIWTTAYRYKLESPINVYHALLKAGVPCNIKGIVT